VRIVDGLSWEAFDRNPKWIAGYSDITVLHGELQRRGYASVHSTMPVSFPDCTAAALGTLKACLEGSAEPFEWLPEVSAEGSVSAEVVGGNLSVLYSLLGSSSFPALRNRIVFLEDVDEMHYHLDRMLMALSRAGVFDGIAGLIAGGFSQMRDNTTLFGFKSDNPWETDANGILLRYFGERGIPVATGFPAGHIADNRAFYLGCPALFEVSAGRARLVPDARGGSAGL
jgi:muramoyltetrapeptide carboxypeptidase